MLNRNESIDVIKGFLIICVLIGHILLGRIQDCYLRYAIYSFHMHLFMFVSGYVININKLQQLSYKDVFVKYWDRMLKMWTVAFVFYTIYQFIYFQRFMMSLLLSPWYHLWYIPTLFCYILLSRFVFDFFNKKASYLILILISFLYFAFKEICQIALPRWCDCTYLIFFALGLFLKNQRLSIQLKRHIIVVPIFLMVITTTWYFNINYGVIEMLCLILVIIIFLYPTIVYDSLPRCRVLSYIGKNSLNIYLWHVLPIIILKEYLVCNTFLYYTCTFLLFLLFILYVKYKINSFGRKY